MGWFDEQIRQRMYSDDEMLEDSLVGIAGAVLGTRILTAMKDDRIRTKNAIDEILKFYHVKTSEIPEDVKDINDQLEYLLRPCGIMRRRVKLEGEWYRDAFGAMLGTRKEDGRVIALIPDRTGGYRYLDETSGRRIKLDRNTKREIEEEALCFYKPLPVKPIGVPELMGYIAGTLSAFDVGMFLAAALGITLLGMVSPKLNHIIFSRVTASGNMRLFLSITFFLVCLRVSALLAEVVRSMLMQRIGTKMGIQVQAAVMMRILSLPTDFFRKYSPGELADRAGNIQTLCSMLVSLVFSTGLTAVFSLVYITQIFTYAPALVVPSLVIILVTAVFSVVSALMQIRVSERQMEIVGKESGMTYSLISGIQKIKLSGAEKRAFARWGGIYAEGARLAYSPPVFLKINSVLLTAISLCGTVIMYYTAVKSGISVADYYAFSTAYGMVSGAFSSLAGVVLSVAQLRPILKMAKPILETSPEVAEGKQMVTRLSGGIEFSNVSFRYQENMPLVVDDLSLKIRPGQYVALVGASGCGKSTLLRLLLGFETPGKGAIYYDGRDIAGMDLKSLRSRIGVVMQGGRLFSGDIFSNITICAPHLTMEEAWEAAELAGIAEDIRRMPMGMHTVISEGQGGISGGQRQRLLIARAIAPRPKILLLDEATSALDNLTQKKVSQSLDGLHCTRIVVAHRLSTIRQCDRIIVLEKGKIIEDGNYEELMEKNGYFAGLIARQRLDGKPFHELLCINR